MKKEIILLCAEYNTISEENTKHLPDDVISHLTKKYNIKPASIRKAKERALTALKACKIEK
jgi:predicted component of type VI protein secretion system